MSGEKYKHPAHWARDVLCPTGDCQAVLFALASRSNEKGECWPGIITLGNDASVSEKTVRRWLDWLDEEGLISRKRRYERGADGKKYRKSDAITLHWRQPISDHLSIPVLSNLPDCETSKNETVRRKLSGQSVPNLAVNRAQTYRSQSPEKCKEEDTIGSNNSFQKKNPAEVMSQRGSDFSREEGGETQCQSSPPPQAETQKESQVADSVKYGALELDENLSDIPAEPEAETTMGLPWYDIARFCCEARLDGLEQTKVDGLYKARSQLREGATPDAKQAAWLSELFIQFSTAHGLETADAVLQWMDDQRSAMDEKMRLMRTGARPA